MSRHEKATEDAMLVMEAQVADLPGHGAFCVSSEGHVSFRSTISKELLIEVLIAELQILGAHVEVKVLSATGER